MNKRFVGHERVLNPLLSLFFTSLLFIFIKSHSTEVATESRQTKTHLNNNCQFLANDIRFFGLEQSSGFQKGKKRF